MRTSLIVLLLALAAISLAQLNSALVENKNKEDARTIVTYNSGAIEYVNIKGNSQKTIEKINKKDPKAVPDPIKRITFNINGTTSSLLTSDDPAKKAESRVVTIGTNKKATVTAKK